MEHLEPDIIFYSIDGNPPPAILTDWKKTMRTCSAITGNETNVGDWMEAEIAEAGFVNMLEDYFKMPT